MSHRLTFSVREARICIVGLRTLLAELGFHSYDELVAVHHPILATEPPITTGEVDALILRLTGGAR